jgi:hypothetical protein
MTLHLRLIRAGDGGFHLAECESTDRGAVLHSVHGPLMHVPAVRARERRTLLTRDGARTTFDDLGPITSERSVSWT